jgi:hypothetical protein
VIATNKLLLHPRTVPLVFGLLFLAMGHNVSAAEALPVVVGRVASTMARLPKVRGSLLCV